MIMTMTKMMMTMVMMTVMMMVMVVMVKLFFQDGASHLFPDKFQSYR